MKPGLLAGGGEAIVIGVVPGVVVGVVTGTVVDVEVGVVAGVVEPTATITGAEPAS